MFLVQSHEQCYIEVFIPSLQCFEAGQSIDKIARKSSEVVRVHVAAPAASVAVASHEQCSIRLFCSKEAKKARYNMGWSEVREKSPLNHGRNCLSLSPSLISSLFLQPTQHSREYLVFHAVWAYTTVCDP